MVGRWLVGRLRACQWFRCLWLVGRCRTCQWVGGQLLVTGGLFEDLLLGQWSVVDGSVEKLLVSWQSNFGGWWPVGCKWCCNSLFFDILFYSLDFHGISIVYIPAATQDFPETLQYYNTHNIWWLIFHIFFFFTLFKLFSFSLISLFNWLFFLDYHYNILSFKLSKSLYPFPDSYSMSSRHLLTLLTLAV